MTGDFLNNNDVEINCKDAKKIFNVIKRSEKVKENLIIEYDLRNEHVIDDWLKTDEFMDKIKYYRILKKVSQRKISEFIGADPETYRQYELKNFDIQDPLKAEKMIKYLELENIVELPDYFKIKKKYDINNIQKIITKFGRETFIKETGLDNETINSWYGKDMKQISTYSYKKMVNFFRKYNIDF